MTMSSRKGRDNVIRPNGPKKAQNLRKYLNYQRDMGGTPIAHRCAFLGIWQRGNPDAENGCGDQHQNAEGLHAGDQATDRHQGRPDLCNLSFGINRAIGHAPVLPRA